MEWIVSSSRDITPDEKQLMARRVYIEAVTGAEVTSWEKVSIQNSEFFRCCSLDARNGSFITAHIDDVILMSRTKLFCDKTIVVVNTCIWTRWSDKVVLRNLQRSNEQVRLWFAKQALALAGDAYQLRESNLLSMVGKFGFLTSKSERLLFANRRSGFEKALCKAFEPVSPVFLPKDFGGLGWEKLLKS